MVDFEAIQQKWSKAWEHQKVGHADIDSTKPKFFIIWAYLTVSGFHHIGHLRGYSYTDAIARFKRLQGHNVLLCAGGHASGNGAVSKAQKIAQNDPETIAYYQDMGLTTEDIESIKTPEGFVSFFSKRYIQDYNDFGFLGDWRRFTVTTNEDYNQFIKWQFCKLKEKNLLIQKPYFGTFSLVSGPVAVDPSETDLQQGGNAEKQEYTVLKLPLLDQENTYITVATLRPETMHGQTNIWIHPDVTYKLVQVGEQQLIMSKECVEKLHHQIDTTITEIKDIPGKELIGKNVRALPTERTIPIFPAVFCDPDKGTGIVTSVPSDAPLDYIALLELKRNHTQYNIDKTLVENAQPIPIIKTEFGTLSAPTLCDNARITSFAQKDELENATKEIYKKGFHTGIFLENAGQYAHQKIEKVKDAMKQELIQNKIAFIFYDLSEEVICRNGGKVIVKKFDNQWFIKYSDEELTNRTIEHAQHMNIQPEMFKNNMPNVLNWFSDRACARQGTWLGTKLPFDESYTVEPIADSTLYPIFYCITKYTNDGTLKPSQLTEQFFDFVFLKKGSCEEVANSINVDPNILEQIQKEVSYWYPLDINLGGKEHQTVHFPVFLMNHTAILPKEYWPKGIFVNWWVTAKGGKISKSKGGAKSIQDEAKKYSADAMRLYYAHIGNPFIDIVFEETDLFRYKQRIEKIYHIIINAMQNMDDTTAHIDTWLSSQLHTRLARINTSMNDFELKNATDDIYFGMYKDIMWYTKRGGKNKKILHGFFEVWIQTMSIFTPFIAEELNEIRGNQTIVAKQKLQLPDTEKISAAHVNAEQMIENTSNDIMNVIKLAKVEQPKKITLIVSPHWKYEAHHMIHQELEQTKNVKQIMPKILNAFPEHKPDIAKIMQKLFKNPSLNPVINHQKEEYEALQDALPLFKEQYNCDVDIILAEKTEHAKANQALPAKPSIVVE